MKVNKAAASDTGSFLSQTGISGPTEFGLTGSDDFQIKVSADGSTRSNALAVAAGTYRLSCSLLLTSMSTTSSSAKVDPKGPGIAIVGKMSMQDFGSRGIVAFGGTTATSGTA